jgi:hypothetical protein
MPTKEYIEEFAKRVAAQTISTARTILENNNVFDDVLYSIKVTGITIYIVVFIGDLSYSVPEYLYSSDEYDDVEERIMDFTKSYGRFLADDYLIRIGIQHAIR